MYTVYKHTNLINNKVYIGQTSYSNPEQRWGKYGQKYSSCKYFYSAILKYDWDNFSHEILETNLTAEEANKKERYYITLYKSNQENFGYNLTSGGEQGKILSPISKQKMSLAKKGKSLSEEHKQNISKAFKGEKHPNYGKHLSETTKKKIGEKNSKPIQCVETGVVYKNRIEAAQAVGLKNHRSITEALRDSWRTAGKDKNTNIRYHWKYVDK
jgi:group I intron endonuclease